MATRVKERGYLSGPWIDSCQVRPFMQIAAMARQGQIIGIVGAAVLFLYDVVDMMRQIAVVLGSRQYSQRSPARRRTRSRVAASISY